MHVWGLVALLTLVLLVAVPGAATAGAKQPPGKDKRELGVMTQNLYSGRASTLPSTATTPTEFIVAVAQIYGTVFTNFPAPLRRDRRHDRRGRSPT